MKKFFKKKTEYEIIDNYDYLEDMSIEDLTKLLMEEQCKSIKLLLNIKELSLRLIKRMMYLITLSFSIFIGSLFLVFPFFDSLVLAISCFGACNFITIKLKDKFLSNPRHFCTKISDKLSTEFSEYDKSKELITRIKSVLLVKTIENDLLKNTPSDTYKENDKIIDAVRVGEIVYGKEEPMYSNFESKEDDHGYQKTKTF